MEEELRVEQLQSLEKLNELVSLNEEKNLNKVKKYKFLVEVIFPFILAICLTYAILFLYLLHLAYKNGTPEGYVLIAFNLEGEMFFELIMTILILLFIIFSYIYYVRVVFE